MRHTNVLKDNQGFTIVELLTIVVIVGILGALAGPSFLAWNQRKQADAAISSLEGAIKEAQRKAMSKSRTCNIAFDTTNPNEPKITSADNCLPTGNRTVENVFLASSNTTMSFNHLGETTTAVTVTVTHQGNPNLQRCLVVSTPLGLIGKGENPNNGVCNP
ncbi:MAG: pilin [Sphaerospermopsis sp. SIO1G1]|nr:pilin [Sphaerospermopsis sp. SIO1G1]